MAQVYEADLLAREREFFGALLAADTDALDRILAPDFMLIDVMSGGEITKPALVGVVGSRQLHFEAIDPIDTRVRHYGATVVVTGRTRMSGRFETTPFAVQSRYTHVYVRQEGSWQLVAAQGTQITAQ